MSGAYILEKYLHLWGAEEMLTYSCCRKEYVQYREQIKPKGAEGEPIFAFCARGKNYHFGERGEKIWFPD
jgi:hypothetical protein